MERGETYRGRVPDGTIVQSDNRSLPGLTGTPASTFRSRRCKSSLQESRCCGMSGLLQIMQDHRLKSRTRVRRGIEADRILGTHGYTWAHMGLSSVPRRFNNAGVARCGAVQGRDRETSQGRPRELGLPMMAWRAEHSSVLAARVACPTTALCRQEPSKRPEGLPDTVVCASGRVTGAIAAT
jgi:hypothetical protein